MCTDVFGEGWGSFRIAHMSTGDRTGVEIFEFKNAVKPENNFEYWKVGIFHFCVQDPGVEGLAAKIVDHRILINSFSVVDQHERRQESKDASEEPLA